MKLVFIESELHSEYASEHVKIWALNEKRLEEVAEYRHFKAEQKLAEELSHRAISEISGVRSERDIIYEEASKEIQSLHSRISQLELEKQSMEAMVAERVAGLAPSDPPPPGDHVSYKPP